MRPIVDKRVDDSPEYNVARDRFLGTTTTSATNASPTLRRDGMLGGAVKKPFGFVQYYGGDKEMVFTPNSPNESRLSSTIQTTTTKNHLHHHHYPLKCLDANAILMASPSLNKTNATSGGDNTTRRNNSMVFGRYDEKSDTMTTTNKRGNNTNKRDDDDDREEEEKNTFTPEISSTTTYANTQNQSKIPTSPVLSLLRTMFSSWNYPNNGTTVIAAEDILSPAADTAKFECGRTPKSSPVDFNASCDDNTHETAFANALFISEASKRLQKICNDQRTRALLDASANGISPGSSRILIDEQICGDGGGGSNSSDDDDDVDEDNGKEEEEEVESVHPSPKKEEVIVAVEQEREYSEPTPITPMSSTSMPTRALFSSPGKASLTDDDDDDEVKKLEMTTDDDEDDYDDDGKYMLFYAKLKTSIKIAAERYIRVAKRCSGDKVARENFCYKLWHHEAFSELFLSATFTALCELSLRLRSAIVWNATNNGIEAVGIESAYFLNYYVDQIGKCLGTAMTTAASSTSSSSSTIVTTNATIVRNYDDKFIYSCVAYAIAYVFVHSLFFLFRVQSPPRSDDKSTFLHSSLEQKISLFQQKLIQNFTPVKRFMEKKKARWDLVRNNVDEEDIKDA